MNEPLTPEVRTGCGVLMTKADGTHALATLGRGSVPAVWTKANRRFAVEFADELRATGISCMIAPVRMTDPVVLPGKG